MQSILKKWWASLFYKVVVISGHASPGRGDLEPLFEFDFGAGFKSIRRARTPRPRVHPVPLPGN